MRKLKRVRIEQEMEIPENWQVVSIIEEVLVGRKNWENVYACDCWVVINYDSSTSSIKEVEK